MTNDILAIATGANTYANLLDMAILASLNRMNVEVYWIPKLYGESAKPYLLASQEVEKAIWRIASKTLKKEQLSELRAAIKTWHEQHPTMRSSSDIGWLSFASEVAEINRSARPGITSSVFNLLAIDPLAGLDPATRELANTTQLSFGGGEDHQDQSVTGQNTDTVRLCPTVVSLPGTVRFRAAIRTRPAEASREDEPADLDNYNRAMASCLEALRYSVNNRTGTCTPRWFHLDGAKPVRVELIMPEQRER